MATPNDAPRAEAETVSCSFCGKTQAEVRKMVAGPNKVSICDECVVLALQLTCAEGGLNERSAYFCFEFVAKLLSPISRFFWHPKSK
jgi:hypothetical protein